VIAIAALSGPVPKLGVIVVALLAGVVIVSREDSARAWAMLAALVLAPVLLLADIWHSPQLGVVHRHPPEAAVVAAVALAALAALATVLARRPRLLGPLAALALPFRIPISVAGVTSNLLVPLYFVIAAACLAWVVPVLRGDRAGAGPAFAGPGGGPPTGSRPAPHRFEQLLAGYLALYAIQATYSGDFDQALENMVFFYVPFALLYAGLRELDWDRALVARCLQVTVALAVVLACIGFVEEATKTLLLNPKLTETNELHPYFTVNSVFFDPDIFGRYLALVMIGLVGVLVYQRRTALQIGLAAALAVLWGGLVLTLSRSSLAALLFGMAVLAALRWRVRPVVVGCAIVIVLGAGALAVSPRTFGLNEGLNNASSGRANLVTGGLHMFVDRPVWGYGSGGFVAEYRARYPASASTVSASHTIPITIAAEQGIIGLLVYLALVIASITTLLRGARSNPVRVGVAAAFLALLLHTLLYADFLEDPLTWTLLAIGGALASQYAAVRYEAERESRRRRRPTAHA
jgi:putative inorganic carbon (HCO3(-)) transporter